jgi:hypothetical protein
MHTFKVVPSAVLSLIAISVLCAPAHAKRRRPPKAADPPPATEVDADGSGRAALATPPPAEPAHDSSQEKATEKSVASAPATASAPDSPRESSSASFSSSSSSSSSSATRHELPEADAIRGAPSRRGDLVATRLTGHVGVGSPLVTLQASGASRHVGSVNEDLTLVAPIGLGLQLTDHWTFDFEFQISTGVRPEGLTTAIVDPGLLYAWDRLTAGLRVGWQLNANQNIGLIPLVRMALMGNERANWFVEASLPSFVRNKQVTTSASLQTGIAF